MGKSWLWIAIIVAVLMIATVAVDTRFGAIGGPILLVAIIVVTLRNRGGSRAEVARAERGAVELRQELERDPEYKEE